MNEPPRIEVGLVLAGQVRGGWSLPPEGAFSGCQVSVSVATWTRSGVKSGALGRYDQRSRAFGDSWAGVPEALIADGSVDRYLTGIAINDVDRWVASLERECRRRGWAFTSDAVDPELLDLRLATYDPNSLRMLYNWWRGIRLLAQSGELMDVVILCRPDFRFDSMPAFRELLDQCSRGFVVLPSPSGPRPWAPDQVVITSGPRARHLLELFALVQLPEREWLGIHPELGNAISRNGDQIEVVGLGDINQDVPTTSAQEMLSAFVEAGALHDGTSLIRRLLAIWEEPSQLIVALSDDDFRSWLGLQALRLPTSQSNTKPGHLASTALAWATSVSADEDRGSPLRLEIENLRVSMGDAFLRELASCLAQLFLPAVTEESMSRFSQWVSGLERWDSTSSESQSVELIVSRSVSVPSGEGWRSLLELFTAAELSADAVTVARALAGRTQASPHDWIRLSRLLEDVLDRGAAIESAEEAFRTAVAGDSWPGVHLSQVLRRAGRAAEAVQVARGTVLNASGSSAAHAELAIAAMEAGDLRQDQLSSEMAVRLVSSDPNPWIVRGKIQSRMKRHRDAAAAFQQAVEGSDDSQAKWLFELMLNELFEAGDIDDFRVQLEAGLARWPSSSTLLALKQSQGESL